MNKTARTNQICLYAAIILLAIFGYGCVSIHLKSDLPVSANDVKKIHDLVKNKSTAVATRDRDLFLDQIDMGNKEYLKEQKSWFDSYPDIGLDNFKLVVKDVAKRDEKTYVARVNQSYTFGPKKKTRHIEYNETFIRTGTGLKFSDLELQEYKTEHFIIKGMAGIHPARLIRIGREAETSHDWILSAYGDAPDDITIIKVYNNQKIMNERTGLGIVRDYVGGWYSYPEAIKVYIPKSGIINTSAIIAHELVHKVTLTKTKNLSVWFAEGLAVYFGDFYVWGGRTYIERKILSAKDHIKPVEWIEAQDFSTLRGKKLTDTAYAMAGMTIMHIEETYGAGMSKAMVDKLAQYPEQGRDHSRNKRLLHDAIEEILGVDMETFNKKWLRWIACYQDQLCK